MLDLIVPARALRWGRLTVEPLIWHEDMLRYAFAEAARATFGPALPVLARLANTVAEAAQNAAVLFPLTTNPIVDPATTGDDE